MVSAASSLLCHCGMKAAVGNMQMNGYRYVAIQLLFTKIGGRLAGWIGPWAVVLQPLV